MKRLLSLKRLVRLATLSAYLRDYACAEEVHEGQSDGFLVYRVWMDVRHGQEPIDFVLVRNVHDRDFDLYFDNAIKLLAAMSSNTPERMWHLVVYYRNTRLRTPIICAASVLGVLALALALGAGKRRAG